MIFTSNFARIKRLPANVLPVSIARFPPWWFKGIECLDLAPTEEMLRMAKAEYDRDFARILGDLDAQQAREHLDSLGENVALLCWESPNVRCHRRAVAEWLENECGIIVPEHGFERAEILQFHSAR